MMIGSMSLKLLLADFGISRPDRKLAPGQYGKPKFRNKLLDDLTIRLAICFWRDKAGWAICPESTDERYAQQIKVRFRGVEKSIAIGFYVNVSELSGRSRDLSSLLPGSCSSTLL